MMMNDATVSDTVCVSNLHEDVTMLQLVEQFGMVGSVKVSTVELKWLYAVKRFSCAANFREFREWDKLANTHNYLICLSFAW